MAIVKMKKLRLLTVRSEESELLRELMLLGCVEISEPEKRLADPEVAPLLKRETSDILKCRADHATLLSALKVLDKHAPEKSSFLTPRPEVVLETLMDESVIDEILPLAREIIGAEDNYRRLSMDEIRSRSLIESLRPWESLDLPLQITGTRSTVLLTGAVPALTDMAALASELRNDAPECELIEISSGREQNCLLLICLRDQQKEVQDVLRNYNFSAVSFSGVTGTALQNIRATEANLLQMADEKQRLAGHVVALSGRRADLKLSADRVGTRIARAEAAERLLITDSACLLEGWVVAEALPEVEALLKRYDCAYETEEPDPENPKEVPIKLKNNGITSPYNMVTGMYSLPAYNGLDANPFVMPAFALFFGIMFADMAYGLILIAASLVIRRSKPRGGLKNMGGIAFQAGITTFIMGFLTGSFFGDAVSVVGGIFGQTWSIVPPLGTIHIGPDIAIKMPFNLLEGNNPLYVLVLAMCIGVVHLAIGVGIGIYLKIRDGQWVDAIFNDLSWWIIFAGIAVMVLAGSKVVLIIGIAMMVLGSLITGKGVGKIIGIFGSVYNGVTGYLGDILSYSRLMALMLAGSVIASVFNQLGSLGGIIMFIPVFIIGHSLNFALNVIGCFVHTMRLQFLEFFGKWYRDGGRPFKPLTINTKYVEIIGRSNKNG